MQNQNGTDLTSVTVNGVSLNKDVSEPAGNGCSIWSGLVTTGSGTNGGNNVTIVTPAAFVELDVALWTAVRLNSNVVKHTALSTTSPFSINVTAGDFLFAVEVSGTVNWSGSTETPFSIHSLNLENAADWTIIATNASFSVVSGLNNSQCAATYR